MSNVNKQEEAEGLYGDAFAEAAKETDGSGEVDTTAKAAADKASEPKVDEAATANKADDAGASNGGSNEAGDDSDDLAKQLEKERQRNRSWEGRISKAEREAQAAREKAEALEAENAALKASKAGATQDNAADKTGVPAGDLNDDERAALEELASEFPTIRNALNAQSKVLVKQILDEVRASEGTRIKSVEDKLSKTAEEIEEQRVREHFDAIRDAHEDYADYLQDGSLDKWIRTLPYDEAQELMEVQKHGHAKDVIGMFDRFKKATGNSAQNDNDDDEAGDVRPGPNRVQAAEAVRRHSSRPARPSGSGKPAKDDFDGAFEIASASRN